MFSSKINKYFSVQARGSSLKTEFLAGLTTFLAMAYIIAVNPSVLGETGMDQRALVIVTCIVSGISTLLMGLIPRVPIAMAPGMGLNAFFAYTIVLGEGVPWQTALGMVFWAGLLFFVLSFWGVREQIVAVIPRSLVLAISVGIGLFILFIGMKNMGLIVGHTAKLLTLGSFDSTVLIGLAGLLVSILLFIRNHATAVFAGIVVSSVLAGIFGHLSLPPAVVSIDFALGAVAFELDLLGALKWSLIPTIFVLFYVDMFDTIGTLLACSREADLVEKDGRVRGIRKMLGVDAVATMMSGLLGTSPTTSYIESGTGIVSGGRTGLTSVVTAGLFFLCIVFAPLLAVIPIYATAPALVMVGFIMIRQVRSIDFEDLEEAIPATLTFVMMPLAHSIAVGLACGFISWVAIKVFLGKFRQVHWLMYLIVALSVASLVI